MFFRQSYSFILAADLIMVLAVWVFNIDTHYILSLLIIELFTAFYFLIFYMYKYTPKKEIFIPSILISVLFGAIIFYGIINIFHMLMPPFMESHFTLVREMLIYQDIWVNLSYFIVLSFFILGHLIEFINYVPHEKSNRSTNIAHSSLSKFVVLSISAVIILIIFYKENQPWSEILLARKIIATITIIAFALIDYSFRRSATIKNLKEL